MMTTLPNTKILFMGTPAFAATALQGLVDAGFNVVGVITRPDTNKGRSGSKSASEVKIAAEKAKIPVFQPENKAELTEMTKEVKPEIIIVAAYGMIIPQAVLDIPKYGAINIHGSLLPKYRGASPIAEAILNGDTETGITIMRVTAGMDAGAIIEQFELPISSPVIPSERTEPRNLLGGITEGSLQQGRDDNGEWDTTESLTKKMAELGAKAIIETIPDFIAGKLTETPQNDAEATYCSKITKEDGHIDWSFPADQIERMIRAYNPWPTAYTFVDGKRIKILSSCHSDLAGGIPQEVPGKLTFENNQIFVGTGTTPLEILTLQPEGKNPMSARDFINGNQELNGRKLT